MKKKIIAIIACVTVITGIFCISALATEPETIIIPRGTEIYFNETVSSNLIQTIIYFKYKSIGSDTYNMDGREIFRPNSTNRNLLYFYISGSYTQVYDYENNEWYDENYRTIIVTYDSEVPVEFYNWIYNNSIITYHNYNIETVLENVNSTWSTTLSVMTVIITWLLANQIALCGLYLYILIACIGIGKRFVKT